MTLTFVLGRAGTGKSERLYQDIASRWERKLSDPPLLLLVPEQMALEVDRQLVYRFGATLHIQALSFRRFSQRIAEQWGGATRQYLNETGKAIVMHRVLLGEDSPFPMLSGRSHGEGWTQRMLAGYHECKRYQIDTALLLEWANNEKFSPPLQEKLQRCAQLYARMDAQLAQHHFVSEDALLHAAMLLRTTTAMAGACVWIDGFHGFTPAEEAVIGALLPCASQVTIALTLPRPLDINEHIDELELFHPTARTYVSLRAIAADAQTQVACVVCDVEKGFRHAPSSLLSHVERQWVYAESVFGYRTPPVEGETLSAKATMTLCEAADPREEVHHVARTIIAYAQQGVRWKDMVIVVREWEVYVPLFEEIFSNLHIAYFLDQKRQATMHPLCELLRALCEMVTTDFSYDVVFRAVKTGLFIPRWVVSSGVVGVEGSDELENIVLERGIRGRMWHAPWHGYAEPTGAIDQARQRIAQRITAIDRWVTEAKTMHDLVCGLYALLEQMEVVQTIQQWAAEATAASCHEQAQAHRLVWDHVCDMFDQCVLLLADDEANIARFTSLLMAGFETMTLGMIPPSLDQVLIGHYDRTRVPPVKYVWMLGVNEGVVPASQDTGGWIGEDERTALREAGCTLAPDGMRLVRDERFLLYTIAFSPSEGLFVSYTRADGEGNVRWPSEWVIQLRQWLDPLAVHVIPRTADVFTDDTVALAHAGTAYEASRWLMGALRQVRDGHAISGVWWAVYNEFHRLSARDHLALLAAITARYTPTPLSETAVHALYGFPLHTTVSRLEKVAACPFAHFATYGLQLAERKRYRLERPDVGQFVHDVLHRLTTQLLANGMSWEQLDEAQGMAWVEAAVDDCVPDFRNRLFYSSERYRYVTVLLKRMVRRTVHMLRMQHTRGSFAPCATELAFGKGASVPPLVIPFPDGTTMVLSGRIDRLDRAVVHGKQYVRVVDYKSRSIRLRLHRVYEGLDLQLLTYGLVATTFSNVWLREVAHIAGAVYFPVHFPLFPQEKPLPPSQIAEETLKKHKMCGLLVEDLAVVRAMDEQATSHSPLVEVRWKAEVVLSKAQSKTVPPFYWDRLFAFVERKLQHLGQHIRNGCIEVSPYRLQQQTPCTFCAHASVCGFDPTLEGYAYREQQPQRDADVWPRIVQEGKEP